MQTVKYQYVMRVTLTNSNDDFPPINVDITYVPNKGDLVNYTFSLNYEKYSIVGYVELVTWMISPFTESVGVLLKSMVIYKNTGPISIKQFVEETTLK